MTPTKPSVGIIGAGIGGLTTAHALLRRGFTKVKVFDQADKFYATAGAGFGLGPNGQICLSSLGLDGYKHFVHRFDALERLNKDGNVESKSNVMKEIRDEYGFAPQGCLRADLVDLLSASLSGESLLYSHKMTKIQQDTHKVHVEFNQSGQLVEEDFDLVIGADGMYSQIAQQLEIDPSPPVYSGANIFYGRIPNPDSVKFQHASLQGLDYKVTSGPGTGQFIMFRVGGDEKKTQIWANTYSADVPPPKTQEWDGIKIRQQHNMEELATILQMFPLHHPIHELYENTTPDNLLHFGMSFRKHKKVWSKGRVCLLGDACHATLPYIGQGANMAIEDAVVMAECLDMEHPNYLAAYQTFFDRRSQRTRRIVIYGRIMDKLHHANNPIARWILELMLKSLSTGGAVKTQMTKDLVKECPVDHAQFRKDF